MIEKRDLKKLFQEILILNSFPEQSVQITGIKIDSRDVKPGDLYLAIKGTRVDGHDYISDAISKGASALVGNKPARDYPVPYLQVEDTREVLAYLAAAWYGFPARQLVVIGVTGTDGKTTTVNLIHRILIAAGLHAGLISTVNAVIGDHILDTGFHVTTPEAMDVQRYLAEMVRAGITHVVLEATSHGLAQKRVAACEFDIGVVTNITHEHLDYHGDYKGYLEAKAELFRLVQNSAVKTGQVNKIAVLNADDLSYPALKKIIIGLGLNLVDYGKIGAGDFQADNIQHRNDGICFDLIGAGSRIPVQMALLGEYNVSNCLAAAGACSAGLGLNWESIQQGISSLPGIPGRMEKIDYGQDFLAVVDFAHTPNALRVALLAARELSKNRVIAIFGSAGLRDKEKRRLMAEVSADLADLTVLTAEDPRTESLQGILEEMAQGLLNNGGVEGVNFWRVPDRGAAIKFALSLAQQGDVVLVCGKGHEQSMCFGDTEYPWDDRTATSSALADLMGKSGPEMPSLPTTEK